MIKINIVKQEGEQGYAIFFAINSLFVCADTDKTIQEIFETIDTSSFVGQDC
jgi:hypothetical protein